MINTRESFLRIPGRGSESLFYQSTPVLTGTHVLALSSLQPLSFVPIPHSIPSPPHAIPSLHPHSLITSLTLTSSSLSRSLITPHLLLPITVALQSRSPCNHLLPPQFKQHIPAYYPEICQLVMIDLKMEVRTALRWLLGRIGSEYSIVHLSESAA